MATKPGLAVYTSEGKGVWHQFRQAGLHTLSPKTTVGTRKKAQRLAALAVYKG